MNNKNKKGYQKVYLNGNCVIDFTKQTINESSVASGNLFFNSEGKLVEGKSDDNDLVKGAFGVYNYENYCLKDSLNVPAITTYGIFSTLSSVVYSSYFPYLQYMKLGAIDTISSYNYDYGTYYDWQKSFYIPKLTATDSVKSSLYKQLITNTYSSTFIGQVYCADDLSEFDLPDYDTDLIISNCSEIKTTEDGAFDYVISNGKVYLISVNHKASYDTVAYDDTLEYFYDGELEPSYADGWSFKFPDTIEGLPVVCISAGIFSISYSSCYGSDCSDSRTASSCLRVELPSQLEIIGAGCFSSFYRSEWESYSSYLPGIKLPDTLRRIYSPTGDYYYATLFGDSRMFTETESLPLPASIEYIAPEVLEVIGHCLSSQEVSLDYIPTQSNPFAFYLGANNTSSNAIISEGCIGVAKISSNTTSIHFPSTIISLPKINNRSNLASVTFAESIACDTIPASFCYQASSSNFTSIVIPEGITKINENAFGYCKYLKDITLPATLTRLESLAFYEGYGVSNLNRVIKIKATTPPSVYSSSSLINTNSNISKIIVPKGCLDAYKKASVWSSFATKMEESTEW
jgi:hypothetical protein